MSTEGVSLRPNMWLSFMPRESWGVIETCLKSLGAINSASPTPDSPEDSKNRVIELLTKEWAYVLAGSQAPPICNLSQLSPYITLINHIAFDRWTLEDRQHINSWHNISTHYANSSVPFTEMNRNEQVRAYAQATRVINQRIWTIPILCMDDIARKNSSMHPIKYQDQQVVFQECDHTEVEYKQKQAALFSQMQKRANEVNRLFVKCLNQFICSLNQCSHPNKRFRLAELKKRGIKNIENSPWNTGDSFVISDQSYAIFCMVHQNSALRSFPIVAGSPSYDTYTDGLFPCCVYAQDADSFVIPLPKAASVTTAGVTFPMGNGVLLTRVAKIKLQLNTWITPKQKESFAHPLMHPRGSLSLHNSLIDVYRNGPVNKSFLPDHNQDIQQKVRRIIRESRTRDDISKDDLRFLLSLYQSRTLSNQEELNYLLAICNKKNIDLSSMLDLYDKQDFLPFSARDSIENGPTYYWTVQRVNNFRIEQEECAILGRDKQTNQILIGTPDIDYSDVYFAAMACSSYLEKQDEHLTADSSAKDQYFFMPNNVLFTYAKKLCSSGKTKQSAAQREGLNTLRNLFTKLLCDNITLEEFLNFNQLYDLLEDSEAPVSPPASYPHEEDSEAPVGPPASDSHEEEQGSFPAQHPRRDKPPVASSPSSSKQAKAQSPRERSGLRATPHVDCKQMIKAIIWNGLPVTRRTNGSHVTFSVPGHHSITIPCHIPKNDKRKLLYNKMMIIWCRNIIQAQTASCTEAEQVMSPSRVKSKKKR